MSNLPLLREASPSATTPVRRRPKKGVFCVIRGWVAGWWDMSTDELFLASWLSRRRCWQSLLPALIYATVLLHVTFWTTTRGALAAVLPDILMAAGTWVIVFLPVHTLRSDACIILLLYLYTASVIWDLPPEFMLEPSGFTLLPTYLFLLSAVGIHSILVMTMGVLLVVTFFVFDVVHEGHSQVNVLESACLGIGTYGIIVTFEVLLSWSLRKYNEQVAATNRLVNQGCHGSLTVGAPSGIVTTANHGFTELVGPDILGRELKDFVVPHDKPMIMGIYKDVSKSLGRPVTATFQRKKTLSAPAAEFDARLVPYQFVEGDVRMICQVIGEIRQLAPSRGAAQEAASRAFAEKVWTNAAAETRGEGSAADTNAAVVVIDPKTGRSTARNTLAALAAN